MASVKSNAILLARDEMAIGIGAGPDEPGGRRRSSPCTRRGSRDTTRRARCSPRDGFFPFPDGVEEAAAAGVTAIIQPGGSVRDAEVIAAANQHGMAMVLTGPRQFRH